MLISFSVSNFRSFKEMQVLDFYPDALKEHSEHVSIPYWFDSGVKLLKAIAFYGHNSYGKSNFIKAYQFFHNCIFTSFEYGKFEGYLEVDKFKLNDYSSKQPSFFQIIFIASKVKYRYLVEINYGKVVREELWYAEPRIRENYLFLRVDDQTKISKAWSKEAEGKVEQSLLFTKDHNLLLSVLLSRPGISRVEDVGRWLKGNIILTDEFGKKQLGESTLILTQEAYRTIIHKFLQKADLGFATISEKIDSKSTNALKLTTDFIKFYSTHELENFDLYTRHIVLDERKKQVADLYFDLLKNESSGSIKYFILTCYLALAIVEGQLILVDELDSKLHNDLLKLIVRVFSDSKNNVRGSQLVFTLHNTSILNDEVLRRDQIVFVHKDNYGESTIIKMHTPERPIRSKSSFEKIYLTGEVGGVSKKLRKDNNNLKLDFGEGQ